MRLSYEKGWQSRTGVSEKMLAFVLSGGGNRGALEVGALQALFEHGIRPQMLVGTSAGAMNAAYVATNPTLEGVQKLAELWLKIAKEDVYPGNHLTMAWRLLTGQDSLFPNKNLKRFIEAHMPPGIRRFLDIRDVKLYVVATNLNTGQIQVFGDDPSTPLLDALMASGALPPYFPPWSYEGWQYIDGAAVANLPLGVALDRGATEIYAIHVAGSERREPYIRGLRSIASQSLAAMLSQQLERELERAAARADVTVHYIKLEAFQDLPFWDFDHAAEMIEEGRRAMEEYLHSPKPLTAPRALPYWVLQPLWRVERWLDGLLVRS